MLLASLTEPEINLMRGGNFEINHHCVVFEIVTRLVRCFFKSCKHVRYVHDGNNDLGYKNEDEQEILFQAGPKY